MSAPKWNSGVVHFATTRIRHAGKTLTTAISASTTPVALHLAPPSGRMMKHLNKSEKLTLDA